MSIARIDAAPVDGERHGATLDLPDPAAALDDQVPERMAIDDALANLPLDFRVPVVLRDQLGLDYAEIAEVLDLAPGTVRSRIARGRRRLAESLAPMSPLTPATDGGNRRGDDDVQGNAP